MGDPEYRTMRTADRGGGRGARAGGSWAGVTGWDIGCPTLEFYVNSGVGHWMSWGGLSGACDIGGWPTRKAGALGLGRRALDWQGLGRGQTGHAPW